MRPAHGAKSILRTSFDLTGLALTSASFILLACGQRGAPASIIAERDSAGVHIVEIPRAVLLSLPAWTATRDSLVLGADTEPELAVFHLAGLPWRLGDGRVVVPNQQYEIRYYDSTGKYLTTFGRRGDGPGEFRQLWNIYPLDGDTLLAMDVQSDRVTVIDPGGPFIRRSSLSTSPSDPLGLQWLQDGSAVFFDHSSSPFRSRLQRGERGVMQDSALLIRTSSDWLPRDTLAVLPTYWYQSVGTGWTSVGLAGEPLLAAGSSGIVAGHGDAFVLWWFDLSNQLSRIIRVAEEPPSLTKESVERFERTANPSRRLLQREGPSSIPVYSEHLPVLSRVRIDRVGRVWVRRWAHDDAPDVEWIIFGERGLPLGRLLLPTGLKFDDVGPDYILGRYIDGDGDHSIRRYRFQAQEPRRMGG